MERKYTGIILNKKDIGEADRIYTIYTLEAGKIRAIAQGVRKAQAKLAGHLENFTLADLTVIKKRGTGRITGSIPENSFSYLRNNLEALKHAFKAADIFNRLVGIEERDEKIFTLLKDFFETFDKISQKNKDTVDVLFYGFVFKLLDLLGYKFDLNACLNCGSPLSQKVNYFSAERGGTLCEKCSPEIKNKIIISNNAIKAIRIFSYNKISSLTKLKIGENELNNLKEVSNSFLSWIKE